MVCSEFAFLCKIFLRREIFLGTFENLALAYLKYLWKSRQLNKKNEKMIIVYAVYGVDY